MIYSVLISLYEHHYINLLINVSTMVPDFIRLTKEATPSPTRTWKAGGKCESAHGEQNTIRQPWK
jgi:hypothetical protein